MSALPIKGCFWDAPRIAELEAEVARMKSVDLQVAQDIQKVKDESRINRALANRLAALVVELERVHRGSMETWMENGGQEFPESKSALAKAEAARKEGLL